MRKKQSIMDLGFLSGNRKSKSGPADQNLKWAAILAIALTVAIGGAMVEAQQAGKIFRIGYLDNNTAAGRAVHVKVSCTS